MFMINVKYIFFENTGFGFSENVTNAFLPRNRCLHKVTVGMFLTIIYYYVALFTFQIELLHYR